MSVFGLLNDIKCLFFFLGKCFLLCKVHFHGLSCLGGVINLPHPGISNNNFKKSL